MLAPKTELVEELSRLTRTPKPEVRQRIRSMFDKGIGPLRMEPLYDTVLADYLIGFIASPTHIEGAEAAEEFGKLEIEGGAGLSAIGSPSKTASRADINESVPALEKLLLPVSLLTSPLRTVLARILRLLAEDAPITVSHLQADLAPYQAFRICITPSAFVPIDLTYGPAAIARNLADKGEDWPIRTMREMKGHVLDRLVHLSTPDSLRRKAREPVTTGA